MSEHDEQAKVITWARLQECVYPELALLFAIANGAALTWHADPRGRRYSPQASKLKSEGLRPGVPDLMLPVARGAWHGLFIEMKAPGGVVSKEQKAFIAGVSAQGYQAVVCYSADEAIAALERYLGI